MNNPFLVQETSNGFAIMSEGTTFGDGFNHNQAVNMANYCNKVQAIFDNQGSQEAIYRFVSEMYPLI